MELIFWKWYFGIGNWCGIEIVFFQPLHWPVTGLTKKIVEDHCRLKIEGSVLGVACRKLLGVSFEKDILGCMEDVKVRPSTTQTLIFSP